MDSTRCMTINHTDGPIRDADGVATKRDEGPLVKGVCFELRVRCVAIALRHGISIMQRKQ